jgi:triphosphoribosyl-dephospho-CoA synthase
MESALLRLGEKRPREAPHADDGAASARQLARRAVRALIAEALLTPKPALVDRRGSGAHHDLDLARLLASAAALRPAFERMAQSAWRREPSLELRAELGEIGRDAESDMLAATGGSNAHRGAIWTLGLLVAGLAMSEENAPEAQIAARAAALARLPDRHAGHAYAVVTHGSRVCARYAVKGARGEARAGFPHVIDVGLPALRCARRSGIDQSGARLDALLAIMARLDDTCLLHRGGRAALQAAQRGAREVLSHGGSTTAAGQRRLLELDADLLARWASPGGSADLLAACLLLDAESPEV